MILLTHPAWFRWFGMGPLRLLTGRLIVALGSNHCWLKGWSLVFSLEEYGGLWDCYGPFGSPVIETNISLLGEMTNSMMAKRVPCWASIFAVHGTIWEGPATAETRAIVLGRSKSSSSRGVLPRQSFLNSNIFHVVDVRKAIVDSLDVVHSVLLIEHVQ